MAQEMVCRGQTMLLVTVAIFLGLSSVSYGQTPSLEEATEVVLEIMNGRGGWEGIQNLTAQQIYTYQNLSGDVEAAAAGASVRGVIEPKTILLQQMRDCVQASYEGRRRRRESQEEECDPIRARQLDGDELFISSDDRSFYYEGYWDGEDAWNREKNDDLEQSECLLEIWADNSEADSSIVLQHYAGASGFVRGMFSNPTMVNISDEDRVDARTMPIFVTTSTLQKDVILLIDITEFDNDWLSQTKEGVNAVIGGLYDRDYFQVVVQSGDKTITRSCGVDSLLRATESNKAVVLDWFNDLSLSDLSEDSQGNFTALVEKGFDLIQAALNSPNNADSGCEPVFLLLSTQQPSGSTVSFFNKQNEEFGVRLFTFGMGSSTDPEGYLGGGAMYDLACSNDGTWFNVEEPAGLPDDMIQYLIVLIYTRTSLAPFWFVRYASHGPVDGLLMIGSLPVFSEDNEQLLGVVSIEFNFNDIQNFLSSLARGFSFAFLTTSEGDLLVHPSYRQTDVVKNLPLYYDVSLIENSDTFRDEIRRPLVEELSGFKKILVDRPLPKGDIGTEGITTIPILTTFFWSRLTNLPFIVVLSFSDADLRSPFYTANADAGFISSSRVEPIFGDADASDFFPDDFSDGLLATDDELLSYQYTAIIDNFRSFLPALQEQALSQVDAEGNYWDNSTLMEPDTIKAIMTFLNNLVILPPYNRNPGFEIQVKELSKIGALFNDIWRADYLSFCPSGSPLGCSNDQTTARFMGFYTQSLITFPGFIDHPLGKTPFFQARFRPWYQRAESNPDVATISPPYDDAFFGGKIITVSQAVFGDPSLSTEEREIVGVVAVDYPYDVFHADFVTRTGCALDRDSISSATPLCYIMDNSALLILSVDFLNADFDTFELTESNTLPVGVAEPELGDQLVDLGLLVLEFTVNFRGSFSQVINNSLGNPEALSTPIDTPQNLPIYSINTTRLVDDFRGTVSGSLSKSNGYCTSGDWTLSKMPGTNLFLIYIEDYSVDTDDDCRTFDLASITNTSFSTCDQNAEQYPFATDLCPNSDQRESVVEDLRPEESKCDRTPPKETEFIAWDDPVAIAMVTVTTFLLVLTFVIWGLVLKYRRTPVILMASPPFISMQFVGFILGYCNIYLWTGEPTDVQCAMRPWLAGISFVLIVGPMFAKTYRVWKLFSPKFFDKGIPDSQVLMMVGAMLLFPIVVCIIWLSYERPRPIIKDDNFDDEKTVFRCDSEGISCRVFEGVMIGYGGILVIVGSFFAFRSRKARSYFNEARFIGFSIYAIASCGVVGVTLSYVLLGLPVAYYVVFCVAVILGIFFTTMIVYFPKLKICIFKPETNVINKTGGEKDNSIISEPNLGPGDDDDDY